MPRKGPAFSNGTMWEMWSANWCDRCLVDAPFRNGISKTGCPLILKAMLGDEVPDEWLAATEDDEIFGNYHCINFRPPGWRDPEPRPQPDPQPDGLFDTPEPGVRMLLPLVESKPAKVSV